MGDKVKIGPYPIFVFVAMVVSALLTIILTPSLLSWVAESDIQLIARYHTEIENTAKCGPFVIPALVGILIALTSWPFRKGGEPETETSAS